MPWIGLSWIHETNLIAFKQSTITVLKILFTIWARGQLTASLPATEKYSIGWICKAQQKSYTKFLLCTTVLITKWYRGHDIVKE